MKVKYDFDENDCFSLSIPDYEIIAGEINNKVIDKSKLEEYNYEKISRVQQNRKDF
jgi:hypothetical protein